VATPDSIAIKRAAADTADGQAVLDLVLEAFAYMEGRIDPPSSAHRLTVEAMAAQTEEGAVFMAEGRDGTLLGCVFLKPKGDAFYLGKLAIRPALQGEGIGRRLFEASIEEARARNLPEIELQARVELTENHAAFAAMGFREVGRTAHDGYDRPTSVTMRYTI
tara:strand:+ start:701 stop:1189 length:489 start_codon:yes stop_codon:yes gene_type:complete